MSRGGRGVPPDNHISQPRETRRRMTTCGKPSCGAAETGSGAARRWTGEACSGVAERSQADASIHGTAPSALSPTSHSGSRVDKYHRGRRQGPPSSCAPCCLWRRRASFHSSFPTRRGFSRPRRFAAARDRLPRISPGMPPPNFSTGGGTSGGPSSLEGEVGDKSPICIGCSAGRACLRRNSW